MRNQRGILSGSVISWCKEVSTNNRYKFAAIFIGETDWCWMEEETEDEKKKVETGLQCFDCFVSDGQCFVGTRSFR